MCRNCAWLKNLHFVDADHPLGNSVGAIESIIHAVDALSGREVDNQGRFGVSLLGKDRLSWEVARSPRCLGLG